MDKQYNINALNQEKSFKSEPDEQYYMLEKKRKKLNDIWCTIFIVLVILGALPILWGVVSQAEHLELIVSYTAMIFFGAALVLATIVKIIDGYYKGQERDWKKAKRIY